LKHLKIGDNWDNIDIADIFDPSQILELECTFEK
jgi:hypothetical protein